VSESTAKEHNEENYPEIDFFAEYVPVVIRAHSSQEVFARGSATDSTAGSMKGL
jgi:hypothetical protein